MYSVDVKDLNYFQLYSYL